MDFFEVAFLPDEIGWQAALVRILISFLMGSLIGLEREINNQPAGLRTHILISIGSTLVMLISLYIPQNGELTGDPGRIAAQVVSGIGFLGAGAILKFGADIKGLTTAASIWATAAVGMAVGAGMYSISIISVVVIFFALTVMNIFEKSFFRERSLRKIEVVVKKRYSSLNGIKKVLDDFDVKISSTGFDRNVNDATDKFFFIVGVTSDLDVQKLADALEHQEGIVAVSVGILR
ncbi:MAG TPA: MgtC/SapB family protein [Mariniphaga sp.]|nr:MgtC/SapB family protein [Mariniphaga sp.]